MIKILGITFIEANGNLICVHRFHLRFSPASYRLNSTLFNALQLNRQFSLKFDFFGTTVFSKYSKETVSLHSV